MKVWPEQVTATINKNGIPLVTCFYGDEPLLSIESVDTIRGFAKQDDYEWLRFTIDNHTQWGDIQSELGGMSLFGEKKVVHLQLPFEAKFPEKLHDNLIKLSQLCAEGSHLVIQLGGLTKSQINSKWMKTLESLGWICPCTTPKQDKLKRWISNRLEAAKIRFEGDVVALLTYRCNGNLLAAKQEIDILKLAVDSLETDQPVLTVDLTRKICTDHARYTNFDLKDACLLGNYHAALSILYRLQEQGKDSSTLPLIGLLQKDVNLLIRLQSAMDQGLPLLGALKRENIPNFLQQTYKQAFTHITPEKLSLINTLLAEADAAAKGASVHQSWQFFTMLVAAFSASKPSIEFQHFTQTSFTNSAIACV
jgi:DNA polymerase-3 subunit delta